MVKEKKGSSSKETPTTEPRGPVKNFQYGDSGYPEKGVKTSGIKIRGTGAATKGVMARGPMA